MTTTHSYIYTVQTYVNWDAVGQGTTAVGTDNIRDLTPTSDGSVATDPQTVADVIGLTGTNSGAYPSWIQLNAENNSIKTSSTPTNLIKATIQKGFTIKYIVRFYHVATTGSTTHYYFLNDDIVKHFHPDFSAFQGKVDNVYPLVRTDKSNVNSNLSPVNGNHGAQFSFTVTPTQTGFTLPSQLTFKSDLSIINNSLTPNTGTDVDASTTNQATSITQSGLNPALSVYNTPAIPTVPTSIKNALTPTSGSKLGWTGTPVYSRVCNQWVGISISPPLQNTKGSGNTYSFTKYMCNGDGTGLTNEPTVTGDKDPKGTQLHAARIWLQTILYADPAKVKCGPGHTTSITNQTGTDTQAVPDGVSSIEDKTAQWNPPPYGATKSDPFLTKDLLIGIDSKGNSAAGNAALQSAIQQYYSGSFGTGRIFQDTLGAATLNKSDATGKVLPAGNKPKQWGFKFMYNPTTFSYSSSSNNNVDWTLGASDPTVLLVGNSQVTFEVYLNRILDMKFLSTASPADYVKGYPSKHGQSLDPKIDALGILNRGTEYDLEYLYRVLNGNPLSNSLLLSPEYQKAGGLTSDFGFTTAVPCWLFLNNNLRYFGSVASMQVNHLMFDYNMVPIFSVVTISFSRYPALWTSGGASESAIGAAGGSAGAAAYTASTGITPGSFTPPTTPKKK